MRSFLWALWAFGILCLVIGEKIAIIGSGSWGTSIAYKLGKLHPQANIEMWTFQELFEGRNLTDIMNDEHCNPKYLPNVTLSANIIASPDLQAVCCDASLLVFVVPHQFLGAALRRMVGHVSRDALAVSLTKGLCLHSPASPNLNLEPNPNPSSTDNNPTITTAATANITTATTITTPTSPTTAATATAADIAQEAPLELLSETIRRELSLHKDVAVLMGGS